MQLILRDGLPFVAVTLVHRGVTIEIANVLVDTGAASTVLNADAVAEAGISAQVGDRLRRLRGVGGLEVVYARHVDRIALGNRGIDGFEVEIGGMDYGFDLGGILGVDFLREVGAVIDLRALTIEVGSDDAD